MHNTQTSQCNPSTGETHVKNSRRGILARDRGTEKDGAAQEQDDSVGRGNGQRL